MNTLPIKKVRFHGTDHAMSMDAQVGKICDKHWKPYTLCSSTFKIEVHPSLSPYSPSSDFKFDLNEIIDKNDDKKAFDDQRMEAIKKSQAPTASIFPLPPKPWTNSPQSSHPPHNSHQTHRLRKAVPRVTLKSPCVIFIPGFMSGKDGDKAKFLREHSHDKYRYDPSGIGDSPGNLGSVRFSDWVDNATSVLEHLGEEENVLVGSSLGAWISVLVAMKDQDRGKIKGLVLIAPALNVLRSYYLLVMPKLDAEALEVFNKGEVYTLNDEEFGEFNMWKALVENIEDFEIDVDGEIPV